MKTQINLLPNSLIPRFVWICATHFWIVVVLSICLSASFIAFQHYQIFIKNQNLQSLQTRVNQQQQNINELSETLANRSSDPELKRKLLNLTKETKEQSRLLNHIKDLSILQQRSFSSLFDALANSHNRDLWLTDFEVKPAELMLKGQLSKPKALPVWISQLSQTGFFQGQEFSEASVNKNDEQLMFSLSSKTALNNTQVTRAAGND